MATPAIVRPAHVVSTVGIGITLTIRTIRRMARVACKSRMDAVQDKSRLSMELDVSGALSLHPIQVGWEMAGLAIFAPPCPVWTCVAANAVLRQSQIGRGARLPRKGR
jgi:hypothetical protein